MSTEGEVRVSGSGGRSGRGAGIAADAGTTSGVVDVATGRGSETAGRAPGVAAGAAVPPGDGTPGEATVP